MTDRHDVIGVVTQPDRPAGRGHKLVATPVKRAAQARGQRVLTPDKLRPFAAEARELGAEAFVVASYGKIVPQVLLDVVPVAFNVHPSLLPLYRGATPLQSSIRDGRTETAVTIIAMDAGMDTGDVLVQEPARIGPDETYGELHDRLASRGAALVVEALERHANGTLERKAQSAVARDLGIAEDEIARTRTRPLRKDDLVLPKDATAKQLVDFVRSLAPEPSARVVDLDAIELLGGTIGVGFARITKAHVLSTMPVVPGYANDVIPGMLVAIDGYWFIGATDGWIAVDELVPAGGKKMTMAAYANGHKVSGPLPLESLRPLAEVVTR
ncbi:MAG: methionyl-tRNA formyltransferase [Candidatus Elarobacter sp.]